MSTTVTPEPQELEFPDPSMALQDMGVDPRGKVEPESGVQFTPMGPQLSDTNGVKKSGAPLGPVHSMVGRSGQVMAGGWSSTTVTVAEHEAEAPWSSVAVSVTNVLPSE